MAKPMCSSKDCKINMDIPQLIRKGEYYEVKVEKVYDPSKFWVIVKFRELAIFMRYLKQYYDDIENRKSVIKNNLKKDLICIVRRGDLYYRSIVLPLLLPDENQVKVFMFDFGYIVNVHIGDIFYIFDKHQEVPRFAIRASLAYISPTDHSKTWSQADLKTLFQVIDNRQMFIKVCEIDTKRKVLFVEIYIASKFTNKSLNDVLVDLQVARYNKGKVDDGIKLAKYISKVKYPHLFPSFERLESGAVPCSLWERDLLRDSVPLDLLYKDYYKYQNIYEALEWPCVQIFSNSD